MVHYSHSRKETSFVAKQFIDELDLLHHHTLEEIVFAALDKALWSKYYIQEFLLEKATGAFNPSLFKLIIWCGRVTLAISCRLIAL